MFPGLQLYFQGIGTIIIFQLSQLERATYIFFLFFRIFMGFIKHFLIKVHSVYLYKILIVFMLSLFISIPFYHLISISKWPKLIFFFFHFKIHVSIKTNFLLSFSEFLLFIFHKEKKLD